MSNIARRALRSTLIVTATTSFLSGMAAQVQAQAAHARAIDVLGTLPRSEAAWLVHAPIGSASHSLLAIQERGAATSHLVLAGLAGGAVGWLAGAFGVGGPLARANPFDSNRIDDGLWTPGIVVGFEFGQAIGIPLAVHLANGRRGDLTKSLAASLALGILGSALLWTGDFDAVFESPARQAVLLAVPLAQLATSIHFARR